MTSALRPAAARVLVLLVPAVLRDLLGLLLGEADRADTSRAAHDLGGVFGDALFLLLPGGSLQCVTAAVTMDA